MLTLVLFLLFVHNSAVPMILQPLKSLANNKKMIMNKSLVEELADADPAQVQQLLDLIETMLLAAHTNLENLEVGCTNANNDYDTAVVTYDAALLSHTGNQEIFDVALEAKNAALEAKVFANGAKIEAQKILDQSKPGLDSEIKTLEEMIHLNGRLSSPNQGLTDMLQGMLKSSQTILGNLERACTNTINDYNDAVIAYNDAVIAYDAAQEKLRVSQEALNVAQDALNVAQGVKTEAQYVLDTGKPGLEVEISNLEEMLSIHGRLNPIKTWKVIIPATKLTGPAINYNVPIPVTHTLHLGNDVWLVGAINGPYLKIVKIRVTGETTSLWMGTRYTANPSSSCKSEITFSEACFEAGTTDPKKDMYPVSLVATIYGPWNYENEDTARTQFTFVGVAQRYALQKCTPSIKTDVTFYVNRDNSRSASEISYLRLDTNEIEVFRFDSGTDPDYTRVVFDGRNLICTGVAGKFSSCNKGRNSGSVNNLPEDVPVRAVIFSIDFNPRSGSATRNQWFRNKYNLKGSYYDAQCAESVVVLPEATKTCTEYGHNTITTAEDCEAAANALDIKWNGCCQNINNEPYGCIKRSDGDILFNGKVNSATSWTQKNNRWEVCSG